MPVTRYDLRLFVKQAKFIEYQHVLYVKLIGFSAYNSYLIKIHSSEIQIANISNTLFGNKWISYEHSVNCMFL
jgi:hypothetical protein